MDLKGWGQSAKLGKHSAIWGKLGTALQASHPSGAEIKYQQKMTTKGTSIYHIPF